ncbi:MAG: TonB-dependent receptor [Acidobacteria bacterium]|nr:TonB-dependent receptor [Acidobacteriota bacterium]
MRKGRSTQVLILVLAWLLVPIGGAMAQTTTATISGVVTDETAAVLPGVTVNVKNVATGIVRSTVTQDDGRYLVPELAPGQYEVEGSLIGFQTVVRQGINLTVGRHAIVDLRLKIGEITDRVTVTGEAPLVETTTSSMGGLVGDTQIRDLPLNSRNFVDLALLETGVMHNRVANVRSAATGAGMRINIHGARTEMNNYVMDGTSINSVNQQAIGGVSGLALGVETIREFQVLTSNFSAEFGRNAGGVINVVTKSGTNAFHGSVFEFLRNDNLDARNFFDRGDNPPEFKRNQFGFSAGGPIRRDKTFIFGGYEGLRQGLGLTLIGNVPTAPAREGILPTEKLTVAPGVKPYLDLWPLPNGRNFGDGRAEFLREDTEVTRQDFYQVRLDHIFSPSDSFFVRYTIDDSAVKIPKAIPNWLNTDVTRNQYVTIEEKKIISPTLLNVFRFGFNRSPVHIEETPLDKRMLDPALRLLPNLLLPGLGQLGVGGLTDPGSAGNRPRLRTDNVFQGINILSYSRPSHSVKIGGEVQRIQTNEFENDQGKGRYSFSNLRAFLLAQPTRFDGITNESDLARGWRQTLVALFIQDDMRIHPTLTLNLGLRWEFTTDPNEVNGKSSFLLDPVVDTIPIVGNPSIILPKRNIAPRIGFAWDPFGDGKSSVRGGFGLFHQMLFRQYYFPNGNTLPPFVRRVTVERPLVAFPNPFSRGASISQAPLEIAPVEHKSSDLPYMMHYNLIVQRELMPAMVLTLAYAGSRGLHLGRFKDPNIAIPEVRPDGRKFYRAGLQRRNPAWGAMRLRTLEGKSWYNALEAKLTRQLGGGLQFQASYTWSHTIDDSSNYFSGDSGSKPAHPQDPYDLKAERAHSNFDLRHQLVFNSTWEMPWGKALSGVAGKLFGGWQINNIVSLASGHPLTAVVSPSLDIDGDRGLFSTRPNLVAGKSNNPVLGGPDRYFDVSSFQLQEPGFYGNLGPNTITGPGLATWDFAVLKNIPISGEEKKLQFRAEFFNLLNRSNFAQPNNSVFLAATGVPSGDAGRITDTTTTSRQIQFGLKLLF